MRAVVASIEAEFRRYKALGEGAMSQLDEARLVDASDASNSIATIVWHIAGNLTSRFTDFLTSDGEKPWRDRDSEFLERQVTRGELLAKWEAGWAVLFDALAGVSDAQLDRVVTIRGQPHTVAEALHRSLAHTCSHVGQIVYIAKTLRGSEWQTLSIPLGQSAQFNAKSATSFSPRRSRNQA